MEKKNESKEKHSRKSREVLFCSINGKARIVDVNEYACKKLGYSKNELLAAKLTDIEAGMTAEKFKKFWASLKRYKSLAYESTFLSKKGTELKLEINASYLKVIQKELCFITARAAKEKPAETFNQLEIALDNTRDGIVWLDESGKYIYANKSACRATGYSKNEILRLSIFDTDPDVTEEEWDKLKKIWKQKETDRLERTSVRKDGTSFPVDVTVRYIKMEGAGYYIFCARDLSEYKDAQEKLRKSEEQLKLALAATNDAIWDYNLEENYLYWSPRYFEMLGYEDGEFSPSVEKWFTLLHPEDYQKANKLFADCIENRTNVFNSEIRLKTKWGTWKWTLIRGRVVSRDTNGKLLRMTGTHVDISEQKRIHEALIKSEQRFSSFMENLPVGAFIKDRFSRTIYVNNYLNRTFGASGWIGKTPIDFFPNDVGDKMLEYDRAAFVHGSLKTIETIPLPNGEEQIFETYRFVLPQESDEPLLGGFSVNITEQKKAQEKLVRTQFSVDKATDSIFWIDSAGRITYVNESACKSLGYTKDELLNLTLFDIDAIFPRSMWKEFWQEILKRQAHSIESVLKTKTGEKFPVEISSVVMRFNDEDFLCGFVRNIFDRKKAEEALKESEAKYRLISENMGDVVWLLDLPSLKFSYVSPSIEKLSGFKPDEIIGKTIQQILAEESYRRVIVNLPRRIEAFMAGDQSLKSTVTEVNQVHKNGSIVPTEVLTTLLTDGSGRVAQILGVARDITERKRNELILKESEERFRTLFEKSSDPIIILKDEKFINYNRAAISILGYQSIDQLYGKSPWELSPEYQPDGQKSIDKARSVIEEMFQKGYNQFEWIHRKADGTDFPVEVMLTPIVLNNEKVIHVVWHDLTKRKLAEYELQKSEKKFRSIIQGLNDTITIIGPDAKIFYQSPSGVKVFGFLPEEMIGQNAFNYIHPDDYSAVFDELSMVIENKREGKPTLFRALKKNGEYVYVEAVGINMMNNEAVNGIVIFSRDVSERVSAERALRLSEERYRLLFELESDAIFLVDNETGRILEANNAASTLYGYSKEELLSLKNTDLSAEKEETRRVTSSRIDPGTVVNVPLRFHKKKDGTIFPVEITGRFFLIDGRPAHIAAIRDISARMEIEKKIKQSEQTFREIFSSTGEGIILQDLEGKILDANKAAFEMYGYKANEFIGQGHNIFLLDEAPFSINEARAEIEKAVEKGVHRFEWPARKKDRSGIWVSVTLRVTEILGEKRIITVVRDVTERKKTEEEVARQRYLIDQLMDVVPDMIYFKDTQSRFISISKSFRDRLKISSPEEIIGKTDFDIFNYEHAQDAFNDEQQIIRTGIPLISKEEAEIWPDGQERWSLTTKMPLRNANGEIIGTFGISRDITEKKKAEVEINRYNEHLRMLLSISQLLASNLEGDFVFQSTTDGISEITGFSSAAIYTLEDGYLHLRATTPPLSPETPQYIRKALLADHPHIKEVITSRKPVYIYDSKDEQLSAEEKKIVEMRNLRTLLYLPLMVEQEVEGVLIAGSVGEPRIISLPEIDVCSTLANIAALTVKNVGLFKSIQDNVEKLEREITERKKIESALRESEFFLQKSQSVALIGSYLYDVKSGCWIGSVTLDSIFGIDSTYNRNLEGWLNLIHPDDYAEIQDYLMNHVLSKKNRFSKEYRIIKYDTKEVRWVEGLGELEFESTGNPVKMIGTIQDITEQKIAQAELDEKEKKFRTLFESLTEGVALHELIYDKTGSPVDYRIIDANPAFNKHTGLEVKDVIGRKSTEVYGTDVVAFFDEYARVALSGEPYTFETYSPNFDRYFRIIVVSPKKGQFATVFEDITERKLKEEELQRRTDEMTRFTYTVSHDLKSPLVTIKAFLGFLESDIESGDSENFRKDVEYIRNATDKMSELLRELLELSRIGRLVNPPQVVEFNQVVKEALKLVAGRIETNKINVVVKESPVKIKVDVPRIVEVFQNLIDNSAKFMGNNPDPKIEIGILQKEGETLFYVKDNGIGIEPKYQHKLFGLFEKLDPKTEGTGIGLALIKRIVEFHGGRIWFESPGYKQGTTFYFTLPVVN